MRVVTYILEAFGFLSIEAFLKSAFGYMDSEKVIIGSTVVGGFATLADGIQNVFGINHIFFIAYAVLIIFEWITGVAASLNKGDLHSSRKLGRMLLKISVYSVPIYLFNTFSKNFQFPEIAGFEFDPFAWLYHVVLVVIVWQLFVSLLENLSALRYKYAVVLLRIINKKFYAQLGIDDKMKDE